MDESPKVKNPETQQFTFYMYNNQMLLEKNQEVHCASPLGIQDNKILAITVKSV